LVFRFYWESTDGFKALNGAGKLSAEGRGKLIRVNEKREKWWAGEASPASTHPTAPVDVCVRRTAPQGGSVIWRGSCRPHSAHCSRPLHSKHTRYQEEEEDIYLAQTTTVTIAHNRTIEHW